MAAVLVLKVKVVTGDRAAAKAAKRVIMLGAALEVILGKVGKVVQQQDVLVLQALVAAAAAAVRDIHITTIIVAKLGGVRGAAWAYMDRGLAVLVAQGGLVSLVAAAALAALAVLAELRQLIIPPQLAVHTAVAAALGLGQFVIIAVDII
jgi:hypothetical protein